MIGKVVATFVVIVVAIASILMYTYVRDDIHVECANFRLRIKIRNDSLGIKDLVAEENAQTKVCIATVKKDIKENMRLVAEDIAQTKMEIKGNMRQVLTDLEDVITQEDSRLVRGYKAIFRNRIPLIGFVTRNYDNLLNRILNFFGANRLSETTRTVIKLLITSLIIFAILSPLFAIRPY